MINKEIDQHKKLVFKVLLSFTFIAGIFFAYININRGFLTIAIVEIIASLISAILFYLVTTMKSKNLQSLIIVYLSVFFSIMIFVFSSKDVSTSVFVWIYIIPLVAYLLLGLRLGFYYTLAFYSLSFIIIQINYSSQGLIYERIMYANIIISAFVIWGLAHAYEKANAQAKSSLRKLAIFDSLTGIHNRLSLEHKFEQILNHAKAERKKISLIAFDLDFFKSINDEYGHHTGDIVLMAFADIIKKQLTKNSTAFRLGGEEFAIIMVSESQSDAYEIAEKIRKETKKILSSKIPCGVTVSSGLITHKTEDAKLGEMMKITDKRLYKAKEQGRDCIIIEG